MLDNLNAIFEVWSFSEIKEANDFCLLETLLYDKNGQILKEIRKFDSI